MLAVLQESFWERLAGIVALRRPTYEATQRDPAATAQAWWIVVLLGLANGIALIVTPLVAIAPGMSEELAKEFAATFTFDTTGRQLAALGAGIVGAILSWYVSSWLLRAIGNRVAGRQVTGEEMRRLVGWGYAPTLASFLTPVPVLGPLLALLGTLWAFVTGVMAVRSAFGIGIAKAVAIEIAAFLIVVLAVSFVLSVIVVIAWPLV